MIIDLPATTSAQIDRKLARLREEGGAVALGRVLTLVVLCDDRDVEMAVAAANEASREHPSRVLVVTAPGGVRARLDAQIRIGGDAGASEVVVLRCFGPLRANAVSVIRPLLLADAPLVAWWPTKAPVSPGDDPVGVLAKLRLTDSTLSPRPVATLCALAAHYTPGDTDLAWSRLTLWRAQLAAALDMSPFEVVTAVEITGEANHSSVPLLAAWLALRLGCATTIHPVRGAAGITMVRLERSGGDVVINRPDGRIATVSGPGAPPRRINLPIRSLSEALIEELRRLDVDEVYEEVVTKGLPLVTHCPTSGPDRRVVER